MNDNRKIAYLRIFSIAVVLLLGGIQYYLVNKSYNLTQEQYLKEITARIDTFQKDSAVLKSERLLLSDMLKLTDAYAGGQLNKVDFLGKLTQNVKVEKQSADSIWAVFAGKRHQLSRVTYTETYDWIVFKRNAISDSLLKGKRRNSSLLVNHLCSPGSNYSISGNMKRKCW